MGFKINKHRILSLLIAICILATSCLPVYALDMSDLANVKDEASLRAAIVGDELWVKNYPNGLFNFVGTQYVVNESQEFLEIAIARQGGTAGNVSIGFKAIDVSAEYGKDYIVRVYENSKKSEMEKNENAIPLIGTLGNNPEVNISESDNDSVQQNVYANSTVQQNVYDNTAIQENIYSNKKDPNNEQNYLELQPKTVDIGNENASKSLKQLRESALGLESDRPDWKEVDRNTLEQLKDNYDEFFYNVPGAETTIEFKDGEYIKYLYIVPLNDKISESEEQALFALTNPTGGAVRGEFYMSYANLKDDEPVETSNFEFDNDIIIAQDGKASVVVRRTSGISQYSSVYIGTEENTAIAEVDYVPGLQELFFTPGMTEQTVTVNLLENKNRTSNRDFNIALDRENKNVNTEKAEIKVIIPSEINSTMLMRASLTPFAAVITDNRNVEKISKNGFSPQLGQWGVVAQDFLEGSKTGTAVSDGYNLKLRANGGEAYARATNIKLYGVEWAEFGLDNPGCGRHWTEYVKKYSNGWHRFWGCHGWWEPVYKEEHYFNTSFGVVSPTRSSDSWEKLLYWGNQGWKAPRTNIEENLWNTSWVGFRTWAASGNQSSANFGWLRLNLKKYTLEVKNDTGNVPKFQLKKYDIVNKTLKETATLLDEQPGWLKIKSVTSNVNNNNSNVYNTSYGVYRSDKIEFQVYYADNDIGRNSTYVGFEVATSNGKWKRYTGTTLSLDANFFEQSGMLDAIRAGKIQVRPVFEQKKASITIKADTENGYNTGIGENVKEYTFTNLKIGDVISTAAKNYSASVTPSWSANNKSALVSTDSTGANISVDYKLTSQSNWLRVDFYNPTIIAKANPNVYLYNVSKPTYKVDGTTYTDIKSLSEKMETIFNAGSDADISVTFKYVFDETYPDPDNVKRSAFGTPQNAILTVYKSDGTVRGSYPSIKTQSSPNNYTVASNNGTYTYSGKLKELGWEEGDFATVIIYGSKKIGSTVISTRENAIDFLMNSGNSIAVKISDKDVIAGDIYNPIVINNADPIKNYEMSAFLNPGFVAKWKDYSGDLNGDGQVSSDEYLALEKKMKSYGIKLDDIYSNNSRLYWGNYFSYTPKFYNPSKIYYNFEKKPVDSSEWTASVIIKEKYRTVLDPNTPSDDLPVRGATIIFGEKATSDGDIKTDEYGVATISDKMFQEGNYYLAKVIHKGYEFNTYLQPGDTLKHVFDTSDVMRPTDFNASFTPEGSDDSEKITLDKINTLVPVENGTTEFKFRVDNGKEGIGANDAIIRIYETNEKGYRTNVVYESQVGKPEGGIFTHSLNLMEERIKPGNRMTISPLYMREGKIAKEYPEVDVGLSFSMNLTVISALASFNTPASPTLEFIGKMNNKFDLGMDLDIDSITEPGTRVDKNGVSHNTKSISFGYNKDFEKKFGDQKDEEAAEGEEEKGLIDKLKETFGSSGSKDKAQQGVKDNAAEDAKKSGSGGGTFNFEFGVSLTLTIEEGEVITDGISVKDGYHYFSSLVLMASGKADFGVKYTYVTPIGIPVFASVDISGSASAIFAIEANDSDRYAAKYQFNGEGKVSLNPTDYSIYTMFFVSPSITIGAGVGWDMLKVFLEGNATVDMSFTVPILGDNAASEGNGGIVISAKVGIKILFIQKKWTIYKSKRIELFSYGNEARAMMAALNNPYSSYLYESVTPAGEDEIIPRDYLNNNSGWLGGMQQRRMLATSISAYGLTAGRETELEHGAYPYPQTKIVAFGDKLLGLFVRDPGENVRDSRNRAQLFYTIYNGSSWSQPQPVDTDATWDEAPDVFVIDDKILVTWSDSGRVFTSEDSATSTLSAMNISSRWFDTNSETFGDEFAITKDTAGVDENFSDINPMISYDEISKRLMVYYTKIDYQETARDYDNTPENDPTAYRNITDDGESSTVYGDIINGYNVIAYRYAESQPDGSFKWNTEYAPEEGYNPDHGFTPEGFYGQRFLDLSVLVEINENEIERAPISETTDEEDGEFTKKPEGYTKTITGTQQSVTAAVYANTDPLVVDSDLITYNGLALYTYILDNDSSKTTTNDQELYMQIYNYELNEFHHPIRLTNNSVQDIKPKFTRTKDVTYLYWISGGDIVYMDITNLVKNNLVKKEVQVEDALKSLYIVEKNSTGINGYINMAIDSRPDYPIEDFQIQSNGDSQYMLWTDYVISYKNGLKAGDPGTEDPKNINKGKQIFAAYCEPQSEIVEIPVTDFYKDSEYIEYVYVDGKGAGTYPVAVKALKDIVDELDGKTAPAGSILPINYNEVEDVNGYKGVVKAGDPAMLKQFRSCDGYEWSTPIQVTSEQGANYSDISFVVNSNNDIQAAYIKYNQVLDESGSFVEDISNRVFASNIFSITSTIKASDIEFSKVLPKSLENLNISATITNEGLKPFADLQYIAYIKQNGTDLVVNAAQDILNGDKRKLLLGGDTFKLSGSFDLPEDITNLVTGFKVIDKDGNELQRIEKNVKAEENLNITVLSGILKDKSTGSLSLYIENNGNIPYSGKLEVAALSDKQLLKSTDLYVGVGEAGSIDMDFEVNNLMFGTAATSEDGSVFDKLELVVTAGNYSENAAITRIAEKAIVDSINNVNTFSIDKSSVIIPIGSTHKLNAITDLNTPLEDKKANPLDVVWRTSNADIASVLPDGTVIGLSAGSATITAALMPRKDTMVTLEDGSVEYPDYSYKLPSSIIQEKAVAVQVGTSSTGGIEIVESDKNIKQSEGSIIVDIKAVTEGKTSTITPDLSLISETLLKLKEENVSKITLTSSGTNVKDLETSKLVLNSDALSKLTDSDVSSVAFETPMGKMELDREALETLDALLLQIGEKQNVTIQISKRDVEKLSDDLKNMIGNRPVYDFSITVGEKNLRDITTAHIPLTLELYNMPENSSYDDVNHIVGAYISEEGTFELIPLSAVVDGKLVIKTTHNSMYCGLYNNVQFEDVSGWSADFIAFLSARGVINGKGNNKFDPESNITRAEFVKIMAAVAYADIAKVENSSFSDVNDNEWYAPYVQWAFTNGLVNGVGDGIFAPDENISRQDMAVMVSRLAVKLGYKLPQLNEEKVFEDNSDISEYAKASVISVQRAGIVNGKAYTIFAPKDYATREESAKMITVLINLIIK